MTAIYNRAVETYTLPPGCAVLGKLGTHQQETALLIKSEKAWVHIVIAFNDGTERGFQKSTLGFRQHTELLGALVFGPDIEVRHSNGRNTVRFPREYWPPWLADRNTVLGSSRLFTVDATAPSSTERAFASYARGLPTASMVYHGAYCPAP